MNFRITTAYVNVYVKDRETEWANEWMIEAMVTVHGITVYGA